MKTLCHNSIRRAIGIRTTIASTDGVRAGALLNRQFRAEEPNRVWVTDFTYVRTWVGWVYVVFIIDVFSRRIIAWHASTSKTVELVTVPLWMALWQRGREGHPVKDAKLMHHSDARSQYTSVKLTEKLALEKHRGVDRIGRGCLRQRPRRVGERVVQDEFGRRVRGGRLGRLVQHQAVAFKHRPPDRVRSAPLR